MSGHTATPSMREALDARQRVVIEWGERCFGADHMRDKIVRAARFFEEAAELVQAVGLSRDHAMRAFDHVYSRPAGTPAQEAGGVANTLMALCGALDLSFDECQQAEIDRCLAKAPEHFAKRNEAKLREVDAVTSAPPIDSHADLVKALEPLAKIADDYDRAYEKRVQHYADEGHKAGPPPADHHRVSIALGECRAARAALAKATPSRNQVERSA